MVEDNSLKMSNDHDDEEDDNLNTDNDHHYDVNEASSLLHHRSNTTNQHDNHYVLTSSSSRNSSGEHLENTNVGISWYFAVFLIVNAALGAGLLNFAKAFDNAGGILVSTVIHLVILVIFV